MASPLSIEAILLFFLAFSQLGLSSCQILRGSVACLDCDPRHNSSGVLVAVKCSNGDSLRAAQTNHKGYFQVAMPAKVPTPSSPGCAARILGGTEQLCAFESSMVSRVVAGRRPGSYALASPLAFFTRCPSSVVVGKMASSSDPRAPTAPAPPRTPTTRPLQSGDDAPPFGFGVPLIYFFPFVPIIGIP